MNISQLIDHHVELAARRIADGFADQTHQSKAKLMDVARSELRPRMQLFLYEINNPSPVVTTTRKRRKR